jgi:hypothetical protein
LFSGLAGFDNPMRDAKTEEVKRHIGQVRTLMSRTITFYMYRQKKFL